MNNTDRSPGFPISFAGRAAIVTGAGNGLGRSFAHALAARGAAVVVNDIGRTEQGGSTAEMVVEEIRAKGGKAVASHDSVATMSGGRAIAKAAVDAFGRIDVLINNAGAIRHKPFLDKTEDDINLTMSTHLLGAINVTQPAYQTMMEQGYGRLLMVSSSSALGLPYRAIYGAVKAGMLGFMHGLAIEGEPHGILCNALMPGAHTKKPAALTEKLADSRAPVPEGTVLPQSVLDMKAAMAHVKDGMAPEFVAAAVTYLVSDHCKVSRMVCSAIAGRYARVFFGLTPGWQGPRDAPPTPEDIEAHFAEVCDPDGYMIPNSGIDELRLLGELAKKIGRPQR